MSQCKHRSLCSLTGFGYSFSGATNCSFVGPMSCRLRSSEQRGVKPWTFGMLMDAAKAVEDLKIKILEICIRICPNRFIVFYPSLNCVSVF